MKRSATAFHFTTGLMLLAGCGGGGSSGPSGTPDQANSTLSSPDAFGAPADGAFPATIEATVRNASDMPISGIQVAFDVTGEGALLQSSIVTTNGAGVATVPLRASVAGQKTVTATIDPNGMTPVPILGAAVVTFVAPREGARFVRVSGNDANSGSHALVAYRTIGHALAQAQGGETIFVGAGTYAENLTITSALPPDAPLELRGDPTGEFTGDAGSVVLDAGGADFGVRLDGVENFILAGFTIVNAAPATEAGGAIWLSGNPSNRVALLDNFIHDNTRGIAITNSARVQVEGNVITNNLGAVGDGIALVDVSNGIVTRNLVYGNGARGILIGPDTLSQIVSHNTLYQNVGVQIRASAGSSAAISHNVVANGGSSGLVVDAGAFVLEGHNVLFGHPANDFSSGAGNPLAATSMTSDPLLVDPVGADGLLGGANAGDDRFTLDPTSPALDAGGAAAAETFFGSGGFARAMTTREDSTLDGQAPDDAEVNLGYLATVPLSEALVNLEPGDLRVSWGMPDEVRLQTARCANGQAAWEAPIESLSANVEARWVVAKRSPIEPMEALITMTDNGTFTNLFARVWDGLEWSERGFLNQLTSPCPSALSSQRPFDAEFEGLSGDLMLVRGNETDIPQYRVWSKGRWSADQPVYSSGPSGGAIRWIELAADPNSDRLCVVCLDDLNILTTSVWDGDAWDTDHTPIDAQIAATDTRAFDVAFESVSGDLLLVYGHTNVGGEEVRFRTRQAGSSQWLAGLLPSIDAYGAVIRLMPNHADDKIALASCEGSVDNDVSVSMWNGTAFFDTAELDDTTAADQRDVGLAWNGAGDRCVVIFRDADAGDTVDYARWRPGGWNVRPDVTVPGLAGPVQYQGLTDFTNNRARFVVQDELGQLFELSSDGDDMQVGNSGAPIGTGFGGPLQTKTFGLVGRP
ncbi:MAG: right-handed parallel beta-helix repeat-containing protein [Planctomycetota bacterium]